MRRTLLFAIPILMALGCSNSSDLSQTTKESSSGKIAPQKRTSTRDELTTMVMGKNQQQVIDLIGKPIKTRPGEVTTVFEYEDMTTDQITGKTDVLTWVWFNRDGIVIKVTF